MKVGVEDRKKLIAAIVLMVLAAVGVYSLMERPQTHAAAAAPASTPQARRQPGRRGPQPPKPAEENLDPTLRLSLLHSSEDMKYEGTGRNIFRDQAEEPIEKAGQDPRLDARGKPTPTPIPTPTIPPPPPIPLRFYGFASSPNDPEKKIFLSEGESIFIAKQGDVVNRRYKVGKISKNSVEIEDLLNNNTQSIPLIQS